MGGWKCQHGRMFCRSCGFGLENMEYHRPGPVRDQGSATAYLRAVDKQVAELEGDVRRGEPVVLTQSDWLVQDGLFAAGAIILQDCHIARKGAQHAVEEAGWLPS